MIESIDQLDNLLVLEDHPVRIVSLVPSQTELLFDLGLDNEVVGVTKFCIHPKEWKETKTRVGGTKTVDVESVINLRPDIIIANKEENTQEQIELLRESIPVWVSDINSLSDALLMIEKLGELLNRKVQAQAIKDKIEQEFETLKLVRHKYIRANVLYFIWQNPFYVAGNNTFINDMLNRCQLLNKCKKERYPEYDFDSQGSSELIFLSTEPYQFKEEHRDQLAKEFPNSKVILVDGEMFSWYGSRLQRAPKYFTELLTD
jgi:ABC-type Fe3+-hydroxamate transport system substrate-binding protein